MLILFFSFFLTNTFANNSYFQCLEKITKVKSGSSLGYIKGNEHGYSVIKLDLFDSKNPKTTIYFKSLDSKAKPIELFKNIDTTETILGFDLNYSSSKDNSSSEVRYSFIKVDDTYVIMKEEYLWSINETTSNKENKYNYESSSRCIKIDETKYLNLVEFNQKIENKRLTYNWAAIARHPKSDTDFLATELSTKQKAINLAMKKCYNFVSRKLNKVGYNDCFLHNSFEKNTSDVVQKKLKKEKLIKESKILKGSRPFALSWEGIDDLIIGKLFFSEKELIGTLSFELPSDNTKCIGTYVLSTIKGTWSIICEKNNKNASGILIWNSENGSVTGNGSDEKGNLIKFKVAGKN